jgi:DNA-binding transcriptional LysR family regulator
VEIREVEAFLEVARELHFGRAAQRLHVTTTSVSQSVRALERRVGGPLFWRTSRRVELTPLGITLRDGLEPAYLAMAEALDRARRSTALPYLDTLRTGFASTLPSWVPELIAAAFREREPGVRLICDSCNAGELLGWADHAPSGVDACVSWLPDPDRAPRQLPPGVLAGPALFAEPRMLVVGSRHRFAGREAIDAEELAECELMRPWGHGPFSDAWTPPRTPGGRPVRRVPQPRLTYPEDLPDLLRDGVLAHLSIPAILDAMPRAGVVGVPVAGLPPVACVPLWRADRDNAWIPELARVVAGCADRAAALHDRH